MDGPERFSRSVRFAFVVILVMLTWLLVVLALTAVLSGAMNIFTEPAHGQEQSTS